MNLLVFQASALDQLLGAIRERGFRVVGPVVRDGAIHYDDITAAADLPVGWADEQDAARYRLRRREPGDGALFGYATAADSWKKYLFPPTARLLPPEDPPPRPLALIGVRACDLAAIAIQDRVFLGGRHPDPQYAARRKDALIVAVNCGSSASTCFCASAGSGPKAESGYDIALTELLDGGSHRFLAEAATERGTQLLATVTTRSATSADVAAAQAVTSHARDTQVRRLPDADLRQLLAGSYDHPRWDDVAARCLSCGNCTMACPTCFCFDITDGDAERNRQWASCFTLDHSYLHGGPVRVSPKARYRQWLTHKLATWQDQFGTPGCVGCGRCITWCPAGIDITEEVASIAAES